MIRLTAAVVALTPALAFAQVYKCAHPSGIPVYQDAPCPPGREVRNFAADPATVSVLPMLPPSGTTVRAPAAKTSPRPRAAAERKEKARTGNPGERRYLHTGMSEGEVLARVGPPDLKSGGGSRRLARWTYMPDVLDPQTLTTVMFEYGKVVEVDRKVVR